MLCTLLAALAMLPLRGEDFSIALRVESVSTLRLCLTNMLCPASFRNAANATCGRKYSLDRPSILSFF
ncbi:hypothetical protein M758_4G089800 [Ceratodon purpureus]|nr:hypothetical protein M758_4G089800 [Ceratodon purpureus]